MKTLERTRTIRLSKKIDQRIEARAAEHGRSASELIRETLEREFSDSAETPGQWLAKSASLKPDRKPDPAFVEAYQQRHR